MAKLGNCIVLSIRREHAQRIFEGSKVFELRKRLPSLPFKRAYLWESGGGGIVGCFDVARVLRDKKGSLWEKVNRSATTKRRFESYFENYAEGFAIEVVRPVKFKHSLSLKELREIDPGFRVPMSSIIVRLSSALGQFLERRRLLDRKAHSKQVMLQPIAKSDYTRYEELVLKHISARYEGIDETFASRTLEVHEKGRDDAGFFTERKQVFSVWHRKDRVGFTTITWKTNGCAKTGPTVIESKYQHKGFGRATRNAVELLVRKEGFRKIYCTCADNAPQIIGYLLDSGMKVEAHLDRQYAGDHGELVFGKFLVADEFQERALPARSMEDGSILMPSDLDPELLKRDVARLFSAQWTNVDYAFADRLVKAALSKGKPDPRFKGRRLVCLGNDLRVCAAVILIPKRGGAVKALLATETEDVEAINLLIEEACGVSCRWGIRKVYFLHPLLDVRVCRSLREAQFQMEGFLRAPYHLGQDVGIFSRFCN